MIKNENFAERLFVDLRNAEYKIDKPSYQVDGHKVGDGPNTHQFNISEFDGTFGFNKGPAFFTEGRTESFTEAYQELLTAVKDLGPKVKFYSLVVPRRGCEVARLEEFEQVVSRYIVDYLPNSDRIGARWDVLVGTAE